MLNFHAKHQIFNGLNTWLLGAVNKLTKNNRSIVYGIEINSCVNNYLEYKGIKKKFNFYKLVGKEELLDDVTEEKREVTIIEEREVTKTSPKDDNQ